MFFQFHDNSGIARVWTSLLREWAQMPFARSLTVLDRGSATPKFPGITYIPFRRYESKHAVAESLSLEEFCRDTQADLFISTFVTMPIETPTVVMVHDMIPELFGNDEVWTREKRFCTTQACAYTVVSHYSADDLKRIYPFSTTRPIHVARNGVSEQFRPLQDDRINQFKEKYGITKPYFLCVGKRNSHKNAELFFAAFAKLPNKSDFAIVCCGGDKSLETELGQLVDDDSVHMLRVADNELNAAYSGATALVFPSRYEGFGLPLLEAMASGCPTITCNNSSLPEIAGEAALYIDPDDLDGMVEALKKVQEPSVRKTLIEAGLLRPPMFRWKDTAQSIAAFLTEISITKKWTRDSIIAQRWREFRCYQRRSFPYKKVMSQLENAWLKAIDEEAYARSVRAESSN